ncbi:MAG: NAD(P)/FAD-dependent oxidoreductase [bacterium]|nr:NAD(P)/FAD-dependent oxidoreductase [bacterium]
MKPSRLTAKNLLELDADLAAAREKYRRERDKRLRADGPSQFRKMATKGTHNAIDPYVEPGFTREPIEDEPEVVIIGGGFGGLLMGARLREAKIDDFRIVEAAGDFGGTWYWNRYPGVQCDVESYVYMPLLEELGYVPTEKYAHGPEIFAHAQAIGRHYGLYERAVFQTQVRALDWDEEARRWIVRTDRDDRIRARFVCMANGPYSTPKLPGIPGLDDFAGHAFHTSRWDYDYTGGDTTGGLTNLADKRVGVIGTGATAIQCVPHLGRDAGHVYVFQRTPSSVDVRDNAPTDPDFARTLEPGWQRRRMDNFNILMDGGAQDEDLVGDRWTELTRGLYDVLATLPNAADLTQDEIALIAERVDLEKMERVRARVDEVVEDPATAEGLKPWYRYLCKRPCFHDEYLPTFNRPNVTLVDTEGRGVERITTRGVVANGREYEVDCLIFATGFDVSTNYTRRAGYEVVGRGGQKLSDKWAERTSTFQSFFTRGFPNCFFMMGFQSGLTPNIPHTINEQTQHLAYVIREALNRGATTVETTQQAENAWCAEIGKGNSFLEIQANCTPGYFNDEGKVGESEGWLAGFYPEGFEAFFALLRDWRAKGQLEGLELS